MKNSLAGCCWSTEDKVRESSGQVMEALIFHAEQHKLYPVDDMESLTGSHWGIGF